MSDRQQGQASNRGDVTRVLISLRDRGPDAWEELVPLVYDELRAIAHNQLRVERRRDRLETTALVHEAFLRLVDQTRVEWRDRTHFFAVAAMVMRRVLINEAHRRKAEKRGGGRAPVSLDGVEIPVMPHERAEELIALDAAITRLEEMDRRQGRVVELRYFGGLSVEETAAALSVSTATVKRDWRVARAWLYREMEGSAP
jgi:RNA polymerase sigma factor (TIGR02999 family)